MDRDQALEDLQVIRRMIDETKKATMYSGDQLILWGVLALVATALTHLFVTLRWFPYIGLVWLLFVLSGWTGAVFLIKKERKRAEVNPFIGRLTGITWMSCNIGVLLFTLLGVFTEIYDARYLASMVAIVLGIAIMITGGLYSWKTLFLIAPLWWIGALLMVFLDEAYLVIYAILIGIGMILPGILARRRLKKAREI